METHLNISLEGEELEYKVRYSRYRETSSDEAEIVIDGIYLDDKELMHLFSDDVIENIKDDCERHYNRMQLIWMRERDDRFSSADV